MKVAQNQWNVGDEGGPLHIVPIALIFSEPFIFNEIPHNI